MVYGVTELSVLYIKPVTVGFRMSLSFQPLHFWERCGFLSWVPAQLKLFSTTCVNDALIEARVDMKCVFNWDKMCSKKLQRWVGWKCHINSDGPTLQHLPAHKYNKLKLNYLELLLRTIGCYLRLVLMLFIYSKPTLTLVLAQDFMHCYFLSELPPVQSLDLSSVRENVVIL